MIFKFIFLPRSDPRSPNWSSPISTYFNPTYLIITQLKHVRFFSNLKLKLIGIKGTHPKHEKRKHLKLKILGWKNCQTHNRTSEVTKIHQNLFHSTPHYKRGKVSQKSWMLSEGKKLLHALQDWFICLGTVLWQPDLAFRRTVQLTGQLPCHYFLWTEAVPRIGL